MMTTTAIGGDCQADPLCHRAPYFQARLEATDGPLPVSRHVKLCGVHLGDMVQVLTSWAHEHGLTNGQVTVLIIDPPPTDPPPSGPPLALPWLRQSPPGGYAFGSISLGH
jgi:hypothetical protein